MYKIYRCYSQISLLCHRMYVFPNKVSLCIGFFFENRFVFLRNNIAQQSRVFFKKKIMMHFWSRRILSLLILIIPRPCKGTTNCSRVHLHAFCLFLSLACFEQFAFVYSFLCVFQIWTPQPTTTAVI